METHFDIEKLVASGSITNELDYERAMIADRKLRLLAKESSHFKKVRSKLHDLIVEYEDKEWSDVDAIDEDKLLESDRAEHVADLERAFIDKRKQTIRKKLKQLDLTQENLGTILGHKSKTHMSELMNGIKPFTLRDLIVISRVLKIDLRTLVPVFLSREDQAKVREAVQTLNNPNVKLATADLVLSS